MTRRIEVYWNLKAKAFSVREEGCVVGHARRLLIRDAKFSVSQAGRRRVIESGHKNVHAFVRGELSAVMWDDTFVFGYAYQDNWTRGDGAYASVARKRLGTDVTYNPRLHETFVDRPSLEPRTTAPMVYLWRFDKSPAILAFDPLLMTEEESKRTTV